MIYMKKFVRILVSLIISSSVSATTLPPAVQQLQKQGIEILRPFTAPGGLQGWLGKYQGTGVTVYVTPDGEHVISGYMYDEKGNNLSDKIINDEIYVPAGREMWKRLQKIPGIKEGSDTPNCQIVVFADPFCPACKEFWQSALPYISNKTLSVKTQLVGILKSESGRYASAILSAPDPADAWHKFELSAGKITPPFPDKTSHDVFRQIQQNQNLMQELGADGTPAIYYLNHDRKLQQILGLPDKEQMADLLACK